MPALQFNTNKIVIANKLLISNFNMEQKTHYPLIRTIYLYLFALLGLILLIFGSVRFLDMGLKAFIFKKAEEEERLLYRQPPMVPVGLEKVTEITENKTLKPKEEIKLSKEEKEAIDHWIVVYNDWKERYSKIDPVTSRRHRDASFS
ncbi:MAG: hypothetical protein ABIJ94_03400, partial [candidate division WOR-3 bacterium]